jgi:hypothetical protein
MSNDPLTIGSDRLLDLIRGLGLDLVDPNDIRRITIDPNGVEVVRFRRNEAGGILRGFGDQPLTETVTIGIDR